jgi:HlyD family secretion protein
LIPANEGDFVKADQLLARMRVDVLDAQRDEARAQPRLLALEAIGTVFFAISLRRFRLTLSQMA